MRNECLFEETVLCVKLFGFRIGWIVTQDWTYCDSQLHACV